MTDTQEVSSFDEWLIGVSEIPISGGFYFLLPLERVVLDGFLILLAHILPVNAGIRVGSIAGILLGGSLLGVVDFWGDLGNREIIQLINWIATHGKFIYGIVCGIAGTIIFNIFLRNTPRFVSIGIVSGFAGLIAGLFTLFCTFFMTLGSKLYFAPDLSEDAKILSILAIGGLAMGYIYALLDFYIKRVIKKYRNQI